MKNTFLFSFLFVLMTTGVLADAADSDGDGLPDDVDNCVQIPNPAQTDTDDDGFGNACDADLNNDLVTNFLDLGMFKAAFFSTPNSPAWNPDADLNGDGAINFLDLAVVKRLFFAPPGPSGDACQPQPAGVVREDLAFKEPTPRVKLRTAVADFQRADPDAVFSFFNCEIDSFSTTPKPTIPDHARLVLAEMGLSAEPVTPQLMAQPTELAKAGQDLDSSANQVVKLPLLFEPENPQPPAGDEDADVVENDPSPTAPLDIVRTRPANFLDGPPEDYLPPGRDTLGAHQRAAMAILPLFLAEHGDLFRLPRDPHGGADISSLTGLQYSEGKYYKRIAFSGQMLGDKPVMGGNTIILMDHNWNVTNISRQLLTPQKLSIPDVTAIDQLTAEARALAAAEEQSGRDARDWSILSSMVAVDPIRRRQVWNVDMVIAGDPEFDLSVLLDAASGELLNVSDNVSAYTDGKVRRWAYSGGNLGSGAYQVTSNNIYTRDDNSLEHDFFYLMTDERGGGNIGQINCTATPENTLWRGFAYNTTNGTNSYIRHTHRSARDFDIWSPAASSGSFAESHTYFWARKFILWLKPTLSHLGVLANSVSDYKRFTFIINSCSDDYYATSSLPVATQHNLGESLYKIRIREECKSTNDNCSASQYDDGGSSFVTCQGNGCVGTPSVIHHEMNHFVMGQYFGISSGLDCGGGNQGKFLHEGMLGSVAPQAFWHFYYGVGFNPPDSNLFTKSSVRGRVHANNATRLDLSDYWCVNNSGGSGSPYEAGRVPGQAMWEIYHGKRADGNSLVNILRPSDDLTFLNLSYWAADLVQASTFKDRYEMANRWMQLSINNLNFANNAQKEQLRSQWCATWEHHELGNFINAAYCP
ncbi:MAG: thrombospondin type 3 repeat-containing protein [Pseudomonadales bacterium]|nr:thrombospondin type 3 repeat-containing protein [Pseudomonadales bacterium]